MTQGTSPGEGTPILASSLLPPSAPAPEPVVIEITTEQLEALVPDVDEAEEEAPKVPGRTIVSRPSRTRTLTVLTADAAAGAQLDAWGASRKDIAEQLGVNPATVSLWRRSPIYIEERAKHTMRVLEDAKNRLQRDRHGAFEAREAARAVLVAQLEAEDAEGNPQHGIRQAAAKILLEDKAATSDFSEVLEVNATVHGAVFHVVDGKVNEDAPPAEAAGEVFEVEDADFEEVESE